MARQKTEIRILVVTEDPSAPRELLNMLGEDSGVRTLFADTGNAVSRTFETDQVDVLMVQIDAGDLPLFETCTRLAREQDEPVPVLAIIKADDAKAAVAAAGLGVEGSVFATNQRQIKRLTLFLVDSVRSRRDSKIAMRRLEEIESRYTLLLDSSSESIAYIHEGLHIYANRAYLELFGFDSFEDLEGLSMLDLLSAEKDGPDLKKVLKALSRDEIPDEDMVLKAHRQDGTDFKATVDFSPARYGGEYCAQMLVREQFSQSDPALAEELEKLKTRDMLTGLLNRHAFLQQLNEQAQERLDTTGLSVLLVSLDKHDELQAKLGLGATDALIRESAALFRAACGEDCVMARLSDHSFGILANIETREEAEAMAARIVDHCSGKIIDVRDTSLTVSASVGLAVAGSEIDDADMLLSQADSALHEALHAGGNAYVRYRPRVSGDADEDDSAWAERLRHALDYDEFRLVTSPITSMDDDGFLINEVETRLRTEDSDEVMMPAVYLPAASRLGLASKLDTDMIRRLASAIAEKPAASDHLWLIPLCLDTICDEESLHSLKTLLQGGKLAAAKVIWGVREPEVRDKLRRVQSFIETFKPLGARFALCDVGPESVVEPLLKHLELDFLRMAPEMIQNLSGNDTLRQALSEMVHLADEHQVRVIAPKVEHTGDLATLWQFGITLVQGDFVREEASA
ncbi:MAG: EAL domain-containing protein [Wenzhouxiangella sp.]|nr:MAG: EAL domain-containing protein [Wenzhouxiangella sp.]